MRNSLRFIPVLCVCLIIFFVSQVPGKTINEAGLGSEYISINGHLFLYLLLGIACANAFKNKLKAFIFIFLYGVVDEFHQKLTPGRSFQYFDILIDSFGGILGILIFTSIKKIYGTNSKLATRN